MTMLRPKLRVLLAALLAASLFASVAGSAGARVRDDDDEFGAPPSGIVSSGVVILG